MLIIKLITIYFYDSSISPDDNIRSLALMLCRICESVWSIDLYLEDVSDNQWIFSIDFLPVRSHRHPLG